MAPAEVWPERQLSHHSFKSVPLKRVWKPSESGLVRSGSATLLGGYSQGASPESGAGAGWAWMQTGARAKARKVYSKQCMQFSR